VEQEASENSVKNEGRAGLYTLPFVTKRGGDEVARACRKELNYMIPQIRGKCNMSKEFITWNDRSARHEVKEFTKPVACPWCGGSDFWLAPWGWVCSKCHPNPNILKEVIRDDGRNA